MPETYNNGATVTAKKNTNLGSYLQGTHIYTADARSCHGHVGGGKWPQDEAKTMPCAMNFYYDNSAVYSKSLLKLF